MYKIPAFGPWPQHDSSPDEDTRLKKAQDKSLTPQEIDKAKQTGIFYGSGKDVYHTDLSFCPCGDFRKRKQPCKHIFRLAMELGIIDLPYKTGESKGEILERQLALADCVELVERLSEPAQHEFMFMIGYTAPSKDSRHSPYTVYDESIAAEFRACPLMEENPYPVADALNRVDKPHLVEIIDAQPADGAPKPRRNAAKATLAAWIAENVPDVQNILPPAFSFSFVINFDMRQPSVQKYLNRKYMTDEYGSIYGTPVPHGSDYGSGGLYWFPDDEITALLTKYGCNRCLNGYSPAKSE